MKSGKKILLTSSLGLTIIGMILMIVGYLFGGWSDLAGWSKSLQKTQIVTKQIDNFDSIKLDCNISDVIIENGNQDKASITYYRNKKYPFSSHISDNTLSVKEKSKYIKRKTVVKIINLRNIIDIQKMGHFGIDSGYTVRITLPNKFKVEQLSGKLKTGELQVEDSQINNVSLSMTAGDIYFGNSKIKNGDLDLLDGSINFMNSQIKNANITLDAGDIEFNKSSITNSEISLKAGDFQANSVSYFDKNKLNMSMGDVSILLNSHKLDLSVTESMGDKTLPNNLENNSNNSLEIVSKTGDIEVE